MSKLKPFLPLLLLTLAAAVAIVFLAPAIHPASAINLPLDSEEIVSRSKQIIDEVQVDVSGYTAEATVRQNKTLVRQVEQQFGLSEAIPLLRTRIPGYFWEVKWRKKKAFDALFGRDEEDEKEAARILAALKGDVFLKLSTSGGLLELERKISDSVNIPTVSSTDAKRIAEDFLKRFSLFEELKETPPGTAVQGMPDRGGARVGITVQSERRVEQPHRVDFEYSWSTESPELKDKILIKVSVAGNIVSRYTVEYQVPPQFAETGAASFHQVGVILLYVVMTIAMIFVAVKRIRAYEIGFRLAIIMGSVTGLAMGFKLYVMIIGEAPGWEILVSILLGILFMGGCLLMFWAVAEAMGRDAWREKFISIDLLTKGYLAHSRVGGSLIVGIATGIVCFSLGLLLMQIGSSATRLWVYESEDASMRVFSVFSPSLSLLADSFIENIFSFAIFLMFSVSFLKKRIAPPVLLILAGAAILGLLNDRSVQPLAIGILISTIVAAVLVWVLHRYDVLAALTGMMMLSIVEYGAMMFTVGHETYAETGYGVFSFVAVVFVLSIGSLYRKKEIGEFETITPAFARQITERQRLQQELEIARHVQMSFLPKQNPVLPGLQIASRCVPALEVGGDYFDFVTLGKRKLAVAVGDVSGKGTQAAFYMTLAKGFLRALSDGSGSVSQVLTQINKLFYENVERGAFISMVYSVFDVPKKKLTLTRAGHNPVLAWKAKAKKLEVIQPDGLALGLEDGNKFSRTIEEVKIFFRRGDCFVFYTDGFTEAMNAAKEEYGEDRFFETVQHVIHGSAEEIVNGVFAAMKSFTGKAKQNDDMTIVVVKIL